MMGLKMRAVLYGGVALGLGLYAPTASAQAEATVDGAGNSNEIVVTATKRSEKLREIAGGVSAQTGEQLQAIGAQDFKDYLTRMPGIVFNEGPSNNSTVIIRGVGTTIGLDQGQGTTGYFINEIPLAEPGYAVVIPDVDAFDVNRVEVLRGPQGSLFGSASLGGAVNYITNVADPQKWDAAAEAAVTTTKNGAGELGYRAKAMINIPLVEGKLAARLTATQRVEPGYVDNLTAGVNGSNDVHSLSLRGSIVFTPDADTTISYLGLYNRARTDDTASSQLIFGPLLRSLRLQPEEFKTQIHSLRLDRDFGAFNLTAIAAYNRKTGDILFDYTPSYDYLNPGQPHTFRQFGESDSWSFEVRLASPKGERFDWLIGATHMNTDKSFRESLGSPGMAAHDPASIVDGDVYYRGAGFAKGQENALFGEANLHFGALTLTAGGRLFSTESTTRSNQIGPIFFGPGLQAGDAYKVSDKGFAPKASIKYQASDDIMVYALASKGFRFGSPNTIFPLIGFDTPAGTTSDSLWNYEAGTRLSFLDRKLLFDVTGFYIDWTNLQVRLVRPDGFTYGANAGAAKIKGLEATISFEAGGFSYTGNATYLDAEISKSIDTASGPIAKGQTLPSAAKWRLSNTASYNFGGAFEPTATLMHRYVSDAPGYLNDPTIFDAYHVFDARLAVRVGDFTVAAFVNNIGDRRAETFGFSDYGIGPLRYYVRPRTFGAQINWSL